MPILFVCPECGARLRAGDELARKRVACPDCRTLLTAPAGEEAEPADAVPVADRDGAVVDPPALPAADETLLHHVVVLDSPTPPRAGSSPGAGARTPGTATVGEWPGDGAAAVEATRLDHPVVDLLSRTRAPTGSGRWAAFGRGCELVRSGLWVELAGAGGLLLVIELAVFGRALDVPALGVFNWSGPYALLPFLLLVVAGAVLVTIGRLRMRELPPETAARDVFGGALALGVVRAAAVSVAVIFTVVAGADWRSARHEGSLTGGRIAGGAFGSAVLIGVAADLTVITGMALAAAVVGGDGLRRSARRAAVSCQLIVVFLLQAVALFLYDSPVADFLAGRSPDRLGRHTTSDLITALAGLVILLGQIAYTNVQASLHAAGRRAATRMGETR